MTTDRSDNTTVLNNDLIPIFDQDSRQGYPNPPVIIAGPCSAESASSFIECAKALKEIGVKYFRAGLWKPRTRPGAFEGVGARGLPWLKRVKAMTGMKVITEVGNAAHVALAVKAGIDGLWLGARTVANPFTVQEIADELYRLKATGMTILVKNPVNPDLELWIGALERLYARGIRRLAAIHRGFSSYAPGEWRNPPQWGIPIELHRLIPNLPIIHDPSHCSGNAKNVPSLARQAMKLCFSGLMVECHISPETALSDAAQQITPECMKHLMQSLSAPSLEVENIDQLKSLRDTVDDLDAELLRILAKRMDACRKIGEYKHSKNITVVQPERYSSLLNEKINTGITMGLDKKFLHRLFSEIHAASVDLQLSLQPNKPQKD